MRPKNLASAALLAASALFALAVATSALPSYAASAGDGASGRVGGLRIEGAWTRQSPPGARTGAAYLAIANEGSAPDTLVGGAAAFADRLEVHAMSMDGGVMRMTALEEGLTIAPGETVVLKPGGLHIMFIGVERTPQAGTTVPVSLRFEKAGEIVLDLPVAPVGSAGPPTD